MIIMEKNLTMVALLEISFRLRFDGFGFKKITEITCTSKSTYPLSPLDQSKKNNLNTYVFFLTCFFFKATQ